MLKKADCRQHSADEKTTLCCWQELKWTRVLNATARSVNKITKTQLSARGEIAEQAQKPPGSTIYTWYSRMCVMTNHISHLLVGRSLLNLRRVNSTHNDIRRVCSLSRLCAVWCACCALGAPANEIANNVWFAWRPSTPTSTALGKNRNRISMSTAGRGVKEEIKVMQTTTRSGLADAKADAANI